MLGVLVALPGIARDFTYEYEGKRLNYTVIDENAKTCMTKVRVYQSESGTYQPNYFLYGELVIPAVAKDGDTEYSVTSIGEYSFARCDGLTSLIIPNSVTEIGEGAFSSCEGLTSVIIPNSVTKIGANAFRWCYGLPSVIIPNSVTEIGQLAFARCDGLKKSAYPSGVGNPFSDGITIRYPREGSIIEDGFVFGPEKKTIYFAPLSLGGEYVIPNSVNEIEGGAFYQCTELTSVTIPESVTTIGTRAFENCYELTSVTIPESVTTIGKAAFNGCRSLTSVAIPASVTEISESAFYDCSSLESVTIPNSVTSIGVQAFFRCSGLTWALIPNSVTSIGSEAFLGCSGLTWALIPNSVTSIGSEAFYGCSGLKKSAYPSGLSNPFSDGIAIQYPREGSIIEDGVVYGPEKSAIYFAPLSLEGDYIIPPSVTTIGNNTFAECYGLKKIAYPSGLSHKFPVGISIEYPREGAIIEDGFVFGPEKKTIYFAPISLAGDYAIPGSVTEIGGHAFCFCSGMTSVTIPNSVTKIGVSAFYECTGLSSVIIPNSVTEISLHSFTSCSGLKKLAYPSGLSTKPYTDGIAIEYPREGAIIEDGFVYGSEKNAIYFAPLTLEGEYTIPSFVTSIGENAFALCHLTAVKSLPEVPPTINDNSFEGLYDTAKLTVPEKSATAYIATNWSLFENLGAGDSDEALETYETGNLKYRLVPDKTSTGKNLAVVIPGDYSALTEVTIPERFTVAENGSNVRYFVDAIGFKAFNGCSNLATVTFNSNNASRFIGDYAFAGSKISTLSIPETAEYIGDHAFDGCSSLANIVIPGRVKAIGSYAFRGCSKLTEITVPGSVRTIGDYAFYSLWGLEKVTLNEGLESIGERAFYASPYFTVNRSPIYIPTTLKSIGNSAFSASTQQVNISDIAAWCDIDFGNGSSNPANGSSLYLNDEKIEDLVIPESVKTIKDYAFGNVSLKSVTFNEALQSIGTSAFNGCNLPAITIPGNVTAIGSNAFYSWGTGIKDITFAYGAKPVEIGSEAFVAPKNLTWDRPGESLNLGTSNLESLTIGNSVLEIPAAKFKGASKLTTVTLGNSLTAIGDEAFSGCTALTEVVLPPSVETIGASAFAGNNQLTSIIMGHNVTTIGEKAYDLCPAQTVSITAQTPPTAPDNTFSNYTGNLYVQGENAVKAYYNSDFCWFQFEGHVLIEPTNLQVEGDKVLTGKPGDTFQLTARLYPEGVTLPQIFWRSTNPDIATVDANGLVTLHADLSEIMAMAEGDDSSANSCRIIAESLYADGPVAEVTVNNNQSGVDTILDNNDPKEIDFTAPVEVYNLQGVKVATTVDHLSAGIYIVRQGKNVMKMAVK